MKTPEAPKGATIRLALTRKQAAAALGVSAMTVDRLVQRGVLKPSRATRRPLFALSELERFLRDTRAVLPSLFRIVARTAAR
jgi:excisionase family DNA binding protein